MRTNRLKIHDILERDCLYVDWTPEFVLGYFLLSWSLPFCLACLSGCRGSKCRECAKHYWELP